MYLVKTPNIIRYFFKDYIWNIDTNKKELYLTFDDGPTPEVTLFVLELLKKYHAKATFFCIGKNIENHPEIFKQLINEGHLIGNHTANHNNGWKTNSVDYLKSIADCEESMSNYKFQNLNSKIQTPNEIATLPLAMTSESQKSQITNPKFQTSKTKTQNPKTQTTNEIATLPLAMTSENQKIKTQNPKPKTQNSAKPKTKDQRLKTIRPPYGKIKRSQAKKLIAKGYKIIMWSVLSGDFDIKISKEKCLHNVIKNANKGSIIVFHDSKKAYNHLKYTLPKVLAYFSEKGYIFKAL